jgi:hypothetical protein
MWGPQHLEPSGPVQACTGIALSFLRAEDNTLESQKSWEMFLVLQIRVLRKIILSYGFKPRKLLFDMLQYDASMPLLFVYEGVGRHIQEDCNILPRQLQAEIFVAKHFKTIFNT